MDDILDEEIAVEDNDNEIIGLSEEELDGNDLENVENFNENDDNNQGQEDENEEGSGDKKEVKPKRVVRNPRVTLNADRLRGPKGLGVLEKCFERHKFKGKGHEEEDLNVILKTYEYWCHRLYPKFPFKSSIEKIEKLGAKGPIQTYLKKVRSGMIDAETDPFNEVVPELRSDDEENEPEIQPTATQSILEDIPIQLTEEQLETIRRNREKAEKLRQERMGKILSNSEPSVS